MKIDFGVIATILGVVDTVLGIYLFIIVGKGTDGIDGKEKNKKVFSRIIWVIVTIIIVAVCYKRCSFPIPDPEPPDPDPISSEPISELSVGDTYKYGNYPQGSGGSSPIEWRVLAVEDGKALLVSERLLDCVKYNDRYISVTWADCSMRKWMNGTFLNKAFSSSEQSRIATTTVYNDDNPSYGTDGGSTTEDKIFALSIEEAERYFTSDEKRQAAPTAYAKSQGSFVSDNYSVSSGENAGWWRLRSPGDKSTCAAIVKSDGSIESSGRVVDWNNFSVRPAFWLILG